MKRKLLDIARELSESDIEELVRIKRDGGKKLQELQKERRKVAVQLETLDKKIAELGGAPAEEADETAKPKRGRRKKTSEPLPLQIQIQPPKTHSRSKGKSKGARRAKGLTEAVVKVFQEADEPLRARQVADALSKTGFKFADIRDARKRVSIVLASQKAKFVSAGRGLYRLA